jgi:O-acetyl-ADP-ribose deacetylase (regulator of RNase III)
MQTTIGKTKLCLVTGDIADQDTDAVVTAAHWRLNKGTGTDGTIHTKGGPRIYEECRRIGGCPIGDAVITTGGNLKARHVIHAVGPVWRTGDEDEPKLLASAYRRSLEVAVQHGLHSISFPSISTGAFGYPIRLAAPVALKAIVEFLRRGQHSLDEVRMVLYTREDDTAYAAYAGALEQLLKEMPRTEMCNRAMNILYIENHAVFAANVTRLFLSQHSVTAVSSLATARAALANGMYDLLLVDYDLDDGKGDELVRELRASGSRIVVVGVSSHDEGNAALLKAGAVAVCSKMDFDRIQSVIDSVTNGR